jgi:hypothetical protein
MNIKDKIVDHLNSNDGKVYVYVSKDKDGLNDVRMNTNNSVDFSKTSTKVVVLFPIGIKSLVGDITGGIYYDSDSSTDNFIKEGVTLSPQAFVKSVNPETKEIYEV